MTTSIQFYEREFEKELDQIRSEHPSFLNIITTDSKGTPRTYKANKEFQAATVLFDKYTSQINAQHSILAHNIRNALHALAVGGVLLDKELNNDAMRFCYLQAVMKGMQFTDLNKLDKQQRARLEEKLDEQLKTPSQATQKMALALVLEQAVDKTNFAKDHGNMASLFFVLVKKLDLTVQKEHMKKIINSTNFSTGFLDHSANKNRRAQELALLDKTEINNEPSAAAASSSAPRKI